MFSLRFSLFSGKNSLFFETAFVRRLSSRPSPELIAFRKPHLPNSHLTQVASSRVKLVQKSPAPGTRTPVGGTPHPDQFNNPIRGASHGRIENLRRA